MRAYSILCHTEHSMKILSKALERKIKCMEIVTNYIFILLYFF